MPSIYNSSGSYEYHHPTCITLCEDSGCPNDHYCYCMARASQEHSDRCSRHCISRCSNGIRCNQPHGCGYCGEIQSHRGSSHDMLLHETRCYCPACKSKRGERSGLRVGRMHRYTYKPAWKPRDAGDGDMFPYHLGVELETSKEPDHIYDRNAIDLRRPKSFWFAKYDASVNGPEFVSHPATLPYWHSKGSELQEMFRLLIHGGYKSHNGGNAGMHVNIARSAFTDGDHLHRFLAFIYANYNWMRVMSQRTDDQISSWASFHPYDPSTVRDMMGWGGGYKHSMASVPDRYRVEFRVPRGTLRLDRFFKNLEWTAAMVAFTRYRRPSSEMNGREFGNWATGYHDLYSNLIRYMEEKNSPLHYAVREDDNVRQFRFEECRYMEESVECA